MNGEGLPTDLPSDPSLDELQQQEPVPVNYTPIAVAVEGPVRVQALPADGEATMRTVAITTTPKQVVNEDPRRSSLLLLSNDAEMRVGLTLQEVTDGTAAIWPMDVPLPIGHKQEVWARTTTGSSNLTVIVERWAD